MNVDRADRVFLDSSLVFFASGQIGYRWAVKVMYMVAARKARFVVGTLFFQEILDRMEYLVEREKGEFLFRESLRLMEEIEETTEADFKKSHELFKKYPQVSPRVLLHAATMSRLGIDRFCATFASGVEHMRELRRVNLMEKVEEVAQFCR